MNESVNKGSLWVSALVAGLVTLVVTFAGSWLIHFFNPSAAATRVVEAKGKPQRKLAASTLVEFQKPTYFHNLASERVPGSYLSRSTIDRCWGFLPQLVSGWLGRRAVHPPPLAVGTSNRRYSEHKRSV